MAEEIEASADAIIDLTRGINNSIKQINNLSANLSSGLIALGSTFRDEGYIAIQGYISKTQNKVNEAAPDLDTVMRKLVEYAQLIRESRKTIGGFSGVTAKIGTGVLAGLAAISSPFAKIENMNDGYDNTNNVPAIYAEMDAPPRLEQIVEQNLPSGYRISKMADLSENISNILEAVAEGKKLKDKQDEVGELNNALRRLKYSDNK